MQRIAMIKDGMVLNVAIWDGKDEWHPVDDVFVDVTDHPQVGVGWSYNSGTFTAPVGSLDVQDNDIVDLSNESVGWD